MISGIGQGQGIGRGARARRVAVDPVSPAGDRQDPERQGHEAGEHLPALRRPESGASTRPGHDPRFVTQLIASMAGGNGERRHRRDDRGVAARASGAYGGMVRLATELEPGFLVRRTV